MYYVVETDKSLDQASTALESAVKHNGLGVLHVHDLGATLRSKGVALVMNTKFSKSSIRYRRQRHCLPTCA